MGYRFHILLTAITALFLMSAICQAGVTGQCANCHTMHNSQGGAPMAGSATPNPGLLTDSCLGCHTGTNTGTNTVPFVLNAAATYGNTGTEGNTLAGGNFAWVAANHRAGHNVAAVPGVTVDVPLGVTPPGVNWSISPRNSTPVTTQLNCAGTNGCHGDYAVGNVLDSVKGSHHAGQSGGAVNGSTLPLSYRMLKGVAGYEDSDWEYQPTASLHNQYKGAARVKGSDVTWAADNNTISSFCAQCHSDFHSGSGTASGGFWIRHPTDFDMTGLGGEYAAYTTYNVAAPLASTDISTVVNTGVQTGGGKAIVMCLSCHRAHGTPYDAILRWDFKGWPAAGYNGCAVCHSTKN